jgi:hypothetical protein
MIEGATAADVYTPAIEGGLSDRLLRNIGRYTDTPGDLVRQLSNESTEGLSEHWSRGISAPLTASGRAA